MPEKYNWISGPGIVDYHGAVTNEFPFWTVAITGGVLPQPGQTLTSMSYGRLEAEAMDWIEWHQIGEHHGFIDPDRYDEHQDAFNDKVAGDDQGADDRLLHGAADETEIDDASLGTGFSFDFDFDWPAEVAAARSLSF